MCNFLRKIKLASLKIIVPNIDLVQLLKINESKFNTTRRKIKYIDKLYYILYVIYYLRTYRRDYTEINGYSPLYSVYLQYVLGNDYEISILTNLIHNNIIERSPNYTDGRSYGYRIACCFENNETKVYEITTITLIKKLKFSQNSNLKNELFSSISNELMLHMAKFFNKLTVEYDDAVEKLQDLFGDEPKKHLACKITLDTIHNKAYRRVFRDPTGRRVHNPITNLKRELKTFLRYDGQPLKVLDISNSQPFFVNYILNKEFKPSEVNFSLITDDEIKNYMEGLAYEFGEQDDVIEYKKLTSEGKLYEYLIETLPSDKTDVFNNRQHFKDTFFHMFYSSNTSRNTSIVRIMKELFIDKFPTIYNYMDFLKSKHYSYYPILMQNVEAQIMIDIISARLMNSYKKIPFFTIHDSFLCLEVDADIIKAIMDEEITKFTGIKANINIE